VGNRTKTNKKLYLQIGNFTRSLFYDHSLVVQMRKAMFRGPIAATSLTGLKPAYQCTDPVKFGTSHLKSSNQPVFLTGVGYWFLSNRTLYGLKLHQKVACKE